MTAMPAETRSPSRPFTYADLELLPDDGHRYELIDGTLLVSPSPAMRHQRAVRKLLLALDEACPDDLEVFVAPFDVVLSDDTVVEPDVLVARRRDLTEKNLPAAPVLAVEVLSPSSQGIDRLLKRERYERAGVASYWIVDPHESSIVCFDLDESGRYVQVAAASGAAAAAVTHPYEVTVVPSELVT